VSNLNLFELSSSKFLCAASGVTSKVNLDGTRDSIVFNNDSIFLGNQEVESNGSFDIGFTTSNSGKGGKFVSFLAGIGIV
jgi:hypothetical protein